MPNWAAVVANCEMRGVLPLWRYVWGMSEVVVVERVVFLQSGLGRRLEVPVLVVAVWYPMSTLRPSTLVSVTCFRH